MCFAYIFKGYALCVERVWPWVPATRLGWACSGAIPPPIPLEHARLKLFVQGNYWHICFHDFAGRPPDSSSSSSSTSSQQQTASSKQQQQQQQQQQQAHDRRHQPATDSGRPPLTAEARSRQPEPTTGESTPRQAEEARDKQQRRDGPQTPTMTFPGHGLWAGTLLGGQLWRQTSAGRGLLK
jgi:hypothetical protein